MCVIAGSDGGVGQGLMLNGIARRECDCGHQDGSVDVVVVLVVLVVVVWRWRW